MVLKVTYEVEGLGNIYLSTANERLHVTIDSVTHRLYPHLITITSMSRQLICGFGSRMLRNQTSRLIAPTFTVDKKGQEFELLTASQLIHAAKRSAKHSSAGNIVALLPFF